MHERNGVPKNEYGKMPLGRWRLSSRRYGRRLRSKQRRAWLRRLAERRL